MIYHALVLLRSVSLVKASADAKSLFRRKIARDRPEQLHNFSQWHSAATNWVVVHLVNGILPNINRPTNSSHSWIVVYYIYMDCIYIYSYIAIDLG